MKFIDLYNKNKDCADFQHRTKQFKSYCYLMKKNPGEFKVEWNKKRGFFEYYQKSQCKIYGLFGKSIRFLNWVCVADSSGKYVEMGCYNRN